MSRECKFICKYNKWTYSPDAEYVIIESKSSESDEGCGDNGSSSVTYFYADGTVAYNKCSRVINDIEADCSD